MLYDRATPVKRILVGNNSTSTVGTGPIYTPNINENVKHANKARKSFI